VYIRACLAGPLHSTWRLSCWCDQLKLVRWGIITYAVVPWLPSALLTCARCLSGWAKVLPWGGQPQQPQMLGCPPLSCTDLRRITSRHRRLPSRWLAPACLLRAPRHPLPAAALPALLRQPGGALGQAPWRCAACPLPPLSGTMRCCGVDCCRLPQRTSLLDRLQHLAVHNCVCSPLWAESSSGQSCSAPLHLTICSDDSSRCQHTHTINMM
jgi:hypothetical protein